MDVSPALAMYDNETAAAPFRHHQHRFSSAVRAPQRRANTQGKLLYAMTQRDDHDHPTWISDFVNEIVQRVCDMEGDNASSFDLETRVAKRARVLQECVELHDEAGDNVDCGVHGESGSSDSLPLSVLPVLASVPIHSVHPVIPDGHDRPDVHERPVLRACDFGERPILVWDTETAGLSEPAICQLSYILIKDRTLHEYDKVLKLPSGIRMSSTATRMHGITGEAAAASGLEPEPELRSFLTQVRCVLQSGGGVVGHNVGFDCRAFAFTCSKLGMDIEFPSKTSMLDTMILSKPYSDVLDKNGRRKQYRLPELYERLFGSPPDWARLHDSMEDVRVTALCFLQGRKRAWW
tara:strand:- start:1628 stop:2677 length:1050 start_codon:yes stop_codon:yes gene_type:complete